VDWIHLAQRRDSDLLMTMLMKLGVTKRVAISSLTRQLVASE
jgi:hypothetical protein